MNDATNPIREEVGVRELRDHLSRYLENVKAGRELSVTEHGKLIARLVPPEAQPSRLEALIASGEATPAKSKPRRHRRIKSAGPISDIVLEQRRR